MQDSKRRLRERCSTLRDRFTDVAREIRDLAELSLREEKSCSLLKHELADHGFEIEREFELVPNAFVAKMGHGRPKIGFLAEYDALPNCGDGGEGPGHGCGHNLLGTGSTYAAIALAEQMQADKLQGTVKLFGCPAEETLVGKVYMARDGAFDDLDACLAWHPGANTSVNNGSGAAADSVTYEFFGKTAHAAADPHHGRSALDAVEIMNVAVNFLREHVTDNVRIHYAVKDGGEAPNVVPSYARTWYYIRGWDREQVDGVAARVDKCAQGAALSTETEMQKHVLAAVYDRLGNDALAQAMHRNLKAVGAPAFTEQDRELARKLDLPGEFASGSNEIDTSRSTASSDEANVSWITPLTVLNVACWAKETPGHHYLVHKQSAAGAAIKGLTVAVKTLAFTGYDLVADEGLLSRVREEFERKAADEEYDPLVPQRQPAPPADLIPNTRG